PPRGLTRASPWPWVAHPVSGLRQTTSALFRLGFPAAPDLQALNLAAYRNSPAHSAKGTPSGDAPKRIPLRLLVGTRFQVLFHSPSGVLFTDRKSTRLNSSHVKISYAVFCLKKK